MGAEESNKSTKPCKTMVVQDETENRPLQQHWYTTQGYHYSMPTRTPIINSLAATAAAGSYYYSHIWPNQTFSTPLQYDPLRDPSRLKNHTIVSGGSAVTFSDEVQTTLSVENMDLTKSCEGNLQPRSSVFKESRENGNESSISKNEQDRRTWSATNGSMGSSDEGGNTDNGSPSSREQQCNMMLANRDLTQNGARIENGNADHENKQESDELRKIMDDLVKKNSLLKDKLMNLSEDCLELNNENNSIEEEITKMYGIESIADLIDMKPGGVTR